MALTAEQVDLIQTVCPHCKAGIVARERKDSREWVHDSIARTVLGQIRVSEGHSICWADGLRKKWTAEANG